MVNDIQFSWAKGSWSKVINSINSVKSIKDEKEVLIKKLGMLDRMRWHKFITKEILEKAEGIWKQDSDSNPRIVAKYFSPSLTFYVTEIDQKSPEYSFWYVFNEQYGEGEFWYINLTDLSQTKTPPFRLPIERDMHFEKDRLWDIFPQFNKEFPDWLISRLDDEINWDPKYEEHCTFTHEELTNKFEVVGKFSDWLENWDDVILSHKDLTPEEKDMDIEWLSKSFINKLNDKLTITV